MPTRGTVPMPTIQDNKDVAVRWFTEYWANGNPAIVDELATDDIVFRYPMHGEQHGKAAVKKVLADFTKAFPDMSFSVVGDLVAEGDYVVGRWEGGGTHTGPAFNDLPVGSLPAGSGKRMHFTGTTVVRVQNGLITEEVGLDEGVTVLKQLGLIPAASSGVRG